MLVPAQVSSRKTSLAGSRVGCKEVFHSCRACCTSARSCSLACRVFFKAQAPLVQLMPQRRHLEFPALGCQPVAQLLEGQVWLSLDPVADRGLHVGDHRFPVTPDSMAIAL